jgi:hypothetical protein
MESLLLTVVATESGNSIILNILKIAGGASLPKEIFTRLTCAC